MKLTYRGVSYDYNPPQVEYGDPTQVGKYRGVDIRFRNPKKPLVLQPTLDLIYRGAHYTSQPVAEAVVAPAATSIQERARQLMMNHHRVVKRRQQSMLTRLDARVGLDSGKASSYWNHIQGKIHPSFGMSYDRSQAAMS